MRVTVFDYGAGNLYSLLKAVAGPDRRVTVATDPRAAVRTDLLVLPGVGAFATASGRLGLGRARLRAALRDGLPCLSICLGMQLLFERSEEGGGAGIGLIPGVVTRLRAARLPHIGWNDVENTAEPLLADAGLRLAWFANTFACRPEDVARVTAWTTHEFDRFPAAVRVARTLGLQFHPEKSSGAGLRMVRLAIDELAGARA
jgi:glutamine amidotransferase